MPTRNIVLTDQQAAMIERLVQSGRYQDANDVLRDGLRLVQQRDAGLDALRQAANVGEADFAAGRYREFGDGQALRAHLAERASKVLGPSSESQSRSGPYASHTSRPMC
jgi:antitoxin ParD1/3/4